MLTAAHNPSQADSVEGGTDLESDEVGTACDLCPSLSSPGQENCNADAEQRLGFRDVATAGTEVSCELDSDCAGVGTDATCVEGRCRHPIGRGDACDPTPCAETELEFSEVRTGAVREIRMDQVLVDARSTEATVESTVYRACHCTAATSDTLQARVECERDRGAQDGQCTAGILRDFGAAEELESLSGGWWYASLDHPADAIVTDPDVGRDDPHVIGRRAEVRLTYGPSDFRVFTRDLESTWNVETDRGRWQERLGLPFDGSASLPAVLWTHAKDTEFGGLASHYWSGEVQPTRSATAPFDSVEQVARWPRLGWTNRFQLLVAPGGQLITLAGREGAGWTAVAWLEPHRRGRWRARRFGLVRGALSKVPATADRRGVSFVGGGASHGLRWDELHALRRGDLRRCF